MARISLTDFEIQPSSRFDQLTDSQPTRSIPIARIADELLHTNGTQSCSTMLSRTANILLHFPQARFWIVSLADKPEGGQTVNTTAFIGIGCVD